jgi:hypothetical protein
VLVSDERVKEIYEGDGKRRVVILRRDSGSYFYEVEYFSEHPLEMCWIPTRRQMVGFYESRERAEDEAYANVDWLKSESGAA